MSVRHINAVFEHAPYDGGTLIVLLVLANFADDEGHCWPSVKTIAAKARLCERQAHNVLRDLRRDGAISVESGGGRRVVNRYRLNIDSLQSISVKQDSVKQDSVKSIADETLKSATQTLKFATPNTEAHCIENHQEPSIEPSGEPSRRDDVAETIYNHYPRKVGKAAALKAITKAMSQVAKARNCSDADAVLYLTERTKQFAESPAGKRGIYTPHPATWFNQARYDDDAAEWQLHDAGKKPTGAIGSERSLDRYLEGAPSDAVICYGDDRDHRGAK